MSFISKMLDAFKLESTREIEKEVNDSDFMIDNKRQNNQEEVKYVNETVIFDNTFLEKSNKELLEDNNLFNNYEMVYDEKIENCSYRSERIIIVGLHIYFISVAREILEQNSINVIPLMREYKLSEDDLNQIICEMQEANIIDDRKKAMISLDEFERFVDIYEPGLFKCRNNLFDKKNFVDIGEIIFNEGVEAVYNILPADEIIDYLNIMEKLKIILYDNYKNKYNILVSKEKFYDICKCVPSFLKKSNNIKHEIDIDNMEGHDFEYFCADILKKNGFENVEVTQGSGDHGIDILAEKEDITYAIQCKCYSSDIGNAAVQQAHTGKSIYKKDIAVVLTNRYFTAQAKEESAALGVKLWDRDKLNSMIEKF